MTQFLTVDNLVHAAEAVLALALLRNILRQIELKPSKIRVRLK